MNSKITTDIDKVQYLKRKKELEEKIDSLMAEYDKTCDERKNLRQNYIDQAFLESGYTIGERLVAKDGTVVYVAGARMDFVEGGDVFLVLNKAKKDGSMSKIREWSHENEYKIK